MRFFLHLAYQGTQYSGWQRQSVVISIQEVLEDTISKMLKEKIYIHGCGRTDSGVHATQYFAHIDIKREIDFDFVERINRMLPSDISIYELIPVDDKAHAQYDVNFRTYKYYFHTNKIPSLASTSAYYNVPSLDFELMTKAVSIIENTSDFRSLCKSPDIYKHTRCKIDFIKLSKNSDASYHLEIRADRFLRRMIRYIVARLLDIGTGKLELKQFSSTLSSRAKFIDEKPGYPQGLYLSKVEYPYLSRSEV